MEPYALNYDELDGGILRFQRFIEDSSVIYAKDIGLIVFTPTLSNTEFTIVPGTIGLSFKTSLNREEGMVNPMEILYSKELIYVIDVTPGYTSQTTGEWIPEVTTERQIFGKIQDIVTNYSHDSASMYEIETKDYGSEENGMRMLNTEEIMDINDRIKIVELDGTTTLWVIRSIQSDYHLLQKYLGMQYRGYVIQIITDDYNE